MSDKEMTESKFEYPNELVILFLDSQSRFPLLRKVQFVPFAMAYIDEERIVYTPSYRTEDERTYIKLTVSESGQGVDEIPVRSGAGPVAYTFSSMVGAMVGCSSSVTFKEKAHPMMGQIQTLFRTAIGAHRAWRKVLQLERKAVEEQLSKLDEWFEERKIDSEEKLPGNEEEPE